MLVTLLTFVSFGEGVTVAIFNRNLRMAFIVLKEEFLLAFDTLGSSSLVGNTKLNFSFQANSIGFVVEVTIIASVTTKSIVNFSRFFILLTVIDLRETSEPIGGSEVPRSAPSALLEVES